MSAPYANNNPTDPTYHPDADYANVSKKKSSNKKSNKNGGGKNQQQHNDPTTNDQQQPSHQTPNSNVSPMIGASPVMTGAGGSTSPDVNNTNTNTTTNGSSPDDGISSSVCGISQRGGGGANSNSLRHHPNAPTDTTNNTNASPLESSLLLGNTSGNAKSTSARFRFAGGDSLRLTMPTANATSAAGHNHDNTSAEASATEDQQHHHDATRDAWANANSVSVAVGNGTYRREVPMDDEDDDLSASRKPTGPRSGIHDTATTDARAMAAAAAGGGVNNNGQQLRGGQSSNTNNNKKRGGSKNNTTNNDPAADGSDGTYVGGSPTSGRSPRGGAGGKIALGGAHTKAHPPLNRTVAGVKAMITTPTHTFWFWSLQPHNYRGLPPKPYDVSAIASQAAEEAAASRNRARSASRKRGEKAENTNTKSATANATNADGAASLHSGGTTISSNSGGEDAEARRARIMVSPATAVNHSSTALNGEDPSPSSSPDSPPNANANNNSIVRRNNMSINSTASKMAAKEQQQKGNNKKNRGGGVGSPTTDADDGGGASITTTTKTSLAVSDALSAIIASRKEQRYWDREDRKNVIRTHTGAERKKKLRYVDGDCGNEEDGDDDESEETIIARRNNHNASHGGEAAMLNRGGGANNDDDADEGIQPASPDTYNRFAESDSDDEQYNNNGGGGGRAGNKLRREDASANASALKGRDCKSSSSGKKHNADGSLKKTDSFLSRLYWNTQRAFNAIDGKLSALGHRIDDKFLKRKIRARDAKNRKRWADHFFWLLSAEQQAVMKGKKKPTTLATSGGADADGKKGRRKSDADNKSQGNKTSATSPDNTNAIPTTAATATYHSGKNIDAAAAEEEEYIASYECWVVHQGGRARGYAMLSSNYLSISCENGYLLDAIPLKKIVSYQRALVYDDHNARWCRFAAQHESKGHCLCAPQFAPLSGNGSDAQQPPSNGNSSIAATAQLLNQSLPASLRNGSGGAGVNTNDAGANGRGGNTTNKAPPNVTGAGDGASLAPSSATNTNGSSSSAAAPTATAIQIFTSRGQVYQLWGFFSNTIPVKVYYGGAGGGMDGGSVASSSSAARSRTTTASTSCYAWQYDLSSIKKSLNVSGKRKNRNTNVNGLYTATGGASTFAEVGGVGEGGGAVITSNNNNAKQRQRLGSSKGTSNTFKKPSLADANAALLTLRNQRGHLLNFEKLFAAAWVKACDKPSSGCCGVPHAGVEYVDEEGYVFVKPRPPQAAAAGGGMAFAAVGGGADYHITRQQHHHTDPERPIIMGGGAAPTANSPDGGSEQQQQQRSPAKATTIRRTSNPSGNGSGLNSAMTTPMRTPHSRRQQQQANLASTNNRAGATPAEPVDNKARAQQAAREMALKGSMRRGSGGK